ncbi:MAG: class I SAM-dependent methyltransferase [Candidatus Dormibacteria bacterium]
MSDNPQDVGRSYDTIAKPYADRFAGELAHKPLDRALLDVFASEAGDGAIVGDVGCGPGQIAAYLHARGLRPVGVDLSAEMIAIARQRHPGLSFITGSMLDLPADDASWHGAIAFYSIIHLAPHERPRAFAQLRRVLRTHAPLLVSFHVGDEVRHVDELYEQHVSLDSHFLRTQDVRTLLTGAGFEVEMALDRKPYTPVEAPTTRGYLLARAL